ncbi:hypothetical protein B0T18DRAFT_125076 [Schizothecium vesticola]|uniref:Uncharacterized protein n=1 Tax=Schizothecium vesticola TaxID=314040 RepID=A0AA40F3K2_9PEZI|nr:hypothetical protein B0T18DRAFT_125076 [Schizothecium vesticola]
MAMKRRWCSRNTVLGLGGAKPMTVEEDCLGNFLHEIRLSRVANFQAHLCSHVYRGLCFLASGASMLRCRSTADDPLKPQPRCPLSNTLHHRFVVRAIDQGPDRQRHPNRIAVPLFPSPSFRALPREICFAGVWVGSRSRPAQLTGLPVWVLGALPAPATPPSPSLQWSQLKRGASLGPVIHLPWAGISDRRPACRLKIPAVRDAMPI